MLQHEVYERARLARDSRFDGQFYVGVTTTGIYCRPICPANAPRSENVQFFPSAAAASEAGFRPCLRCRPEAAPGTPAWSGTSTTVRRGLRLISNGALDEGNVEELADRLGVTSRHLRRLFTKHLGASPLAVAHTQRLHFAKRLIDETTLPMSHISSAAGYGSIRRFNDAFQQTYGRSPRELRRAGEEVPPEKGALLRVRLPYRMPFDWSKQLSFFADRATPCVETADDGFYSRTVVHEGQHGVIRIGPDARNGYLSLTLEGIDTNALFEFVQRLREVFDLDAPLADIRRSLSQDSVINDMLKENPGVRVPGAWDGFELTVRAILGQQVSVKAATTLTGRVAARYGDKLNAHLASGHSQLQHIFPSPDKLARARFNDMGIVGSRIETTRQVAKAVLRGELNFDVVQDPEEFCTTLTSIRGVGDWTAQYVAMRVLKNPDAFPAADLGLQKALGNGQKLTAGELTARAENWRPWRAYAALLLWGSLPNSGG